MRLCTPMVIAALLLQAPHPLAAQAADPVPRSRPGWSLQRTMREFIHDLERSAPGYFPTRGEWEYVSRIRYRGAGERVGIHRFPAAQSAGAIARPNGPLCNSFNSGDGGVFPSLAYYADPGGWRRVGGTRFEPRDAEPGWSVWVEWRREDGRWVVSSIGEQGEAGPMVLGTDAREARDTMRGRRLTLPLPATARLATDAPWYTGEVLNLSGPPYLKQRTTRKMEAGRLVYYATVDGVMVWIEPRELASSWGPAVVYVPVDRFGVFLPYVTGRGNGCN